MFDSLLKQLIPRWFPESRIHSCERVGSGFSGAVVWKLCLEAVSSFPHGPQQHWAIRCWPSGSNLERVLEIHSVIRHAQRHPCSFLPQYRPCQQSSATAFECQQRIWECSQWMPGATPNLSSSADLIASQLGTALAQFHDATASLGRRIDRSALAIDSRLHRMQTLDQIWNQRSFVPLVAGVDAKLQWAVSILQQQWRRNTTNAKAALNQLQQLAWPQQYVFRDVHCQNTLFCHSQLTAILDFDALRVDTPATDVARLIGSMQLGMTDDLWFGDAANTSQTFGIGYREKAWKSLLAAYRQIRAFSEEEERLARVLVDVSPLVNLANWVTWLTHEPERFQDRMDEAITRMCEWARVVLGDCLHRGPS